MPQRTQRISGHSQKTEIINKQSNKTESGVATLRNADWAPQAKETNSSNILTTDTSTEIFCKLFVN